MACNKEVYDKISYNKSGNNFPPKIIVNNCMFCYNSYIIGNIHAVHLLTKLRNGM